MSKLYSSKLYPTRNLGILQVICAGICFGFLGPFGRFAYDAGISPLELLGPRFLLSGSLLFLGVLFFGGKKKIILPAKQLMLCLALGVFGYALFSSFYFFSIKSLSISLAVLLLYTFPIWVTLGSRIFFGEKIPKNRLFTLPMTMVGIVCLLGGNFNVSHYIGIVFGLSGAIFYAIYVLISDRQLAKINAFTSVTYIQLSAGFTLCLIGIPNFQRGMEIFQSIWPIILSMAVICSIGAMTLFQSGLQKLKSWEASILSTSEPITGIALAFILFKERLTIIQIFGAILVMVAFVAISIPTKQQEKNI